MKSNAEFSLRALQSGNQGGGVCDLHLVERLRRQHVVLIRPKRQNATQYALHTLYFTKEILTASVKP